MSLWPDLIKCPADGWHHSVMSFGAAIGSGTSESGQFLAWTQVMDHHLSVVLRYGYESVWRDVQPVDSRLGLDVGERCPHVPQVPNFDGTVVWPGDDLVRSRPLLTGENCTGHAFSVALCPIERETGFYNIRLEIRRYTKYYSFSRMCNIESGQRLQCPRIHLFHISCAGSKCSTTPPLR